MEVREQRVADIRRLRAEGQPYSAIARALGISQGRVRELLHADQKKHDARLQRELLVQCIQLISHYKDGEPLATDLAAIETLLVLLRKWDGDDHDAP